MSAPFNPLSYWLGSFQSPLSGNVAEKISAPWFSPALTVNYAGDPAIEEKVVNEIASYGKQIGWLNEVVLGLAATANLPQPLGETVLQIAETTRKIEEIKAAKENDALQKAIESLNLLQRDQPDAYARLILQRSRTSLQ